MTHPTALSRRTLLGLAVPSALALAGCEGSRLPPPVRRAAGSPTPRRGGTLRFSIFSEASTLDPAAALDTYAAEAVSLLCDTLLDYAPATSRDPTELIPQLAERWTCSADGTLYTFHRRRGARFSNGEPLVAEDFVYTLDRLLDPKMASPMAGLFAGITGAADRLAGKTSHIEGVRAPGASTLEIRLDRPDPSFAYLLALSPTTPLKKSHVDAVGPEIRRRPLGTGPFVLRELEEGRRIVYDRNPLYWNPERPFLDRIVTDFNVLASTAALRFLQGEYDTLFNPAQDDYLRFASSPAWEPYLVRTVQPATVTFYVNTRMPPFTDRRVRLAMNHAIDKEALARVTNGRLSAGNGLLPPVLREHRRDRAPYAYDPERARRLLAEAGHPGGFDMVYSTVMEGYANPWAESIQADLAAVGIRMKIEYLTGPAINSALSAGRIAATAQTWFMDFPAPWNFLEPIFHSRMVPPNGYNFSFYSSPQFDRLLDEARHEVDGEKRVALYRRAEDLVYDDCPVVWIGFPVLAEVLHPHVRGYKYHPCRWRSYRDTWLDAAVEETP